MHHSPAVCTPNRTPSETHQHTRNTIEFTTLDTDLLAEWATATREEFRPGSPPIQDGDLRLHELASHFGQKTEEVTALMTPTGLLKVWLAPRQDFCGRVLSWGC
jgi:hypothetical protein